MEIITESGEHFDMPADYSLDIEFINPVLDEVGSQTVPGTLPYTPHNLRLLDFSDRMDRANKYTIKRNVTLQEGVFMKKATQAVLKANRYDKIVSTSYFDEAVFYEKIKGIKLNTINYQIDPAFPTQVNPSVNGCIDFIFQVMAQTRESDFHVFPVLTKLDKYPNFLDIQEKPDVLNRILHDNTQPLVIKDWSDRTDTVENATINYPAGYGITFFLKISYILESIARELGYSVGTNVFKTHPELKNLVLVNDVADTIVRGYVDYRQLVPGITVSDFLTCLKKKFGAFVLAVDENQKLIHIELIDNILKLPADIDLTDYVTEYPRIEWTTPKQIKLSAGTSLPFSKTETELYEDFVKIHGEPEPWTLLGGLLLNKAYLDKSTLSLIMYVPNNETPSWQTNKMVQLSSSNFAYYTKESIDFEEMTSEDEQLAEVVIMEYSGDASVESYLLPIVGNRRNVNTTLYINDKAQDSSNAEMPLMFCFRVPAISPEGTSRKTCGTPYSSGFEEGEWGNLSLTYQGEHGLYNAFWKKYDTCLRSSFHTVRCPMNIPFVKLQQLKLHTPKLLFNQPVLIERIKCKIGNGKCKITEAVFRTLRAYED